MGAAEEAARAAGGGLVLPLYTFRTFAGRGSRRLGGGSRWRFGRFFRSLLSRRGGVIFRYVAVVRVEMGAPEQVMLPFVMVFNELDAEEAKAAE